ncbi:MAG: alpha/beta hydrolase [Dehalococcoidia bacterium]|nr:alpha/beta hydrolase [Dehalococcoidia bacterium]
MPSTNDCPDDWSSRFFHANGIRHHCLEWGDPRNPPLLMLHATGLCAWPWKPVARRLAQRYRVLAFDQRGHGDTEKSDKGYRFEYAGEDLAAIIETMELDRPRVVGHSSGGLATIIAANILPDVFGPVVLVETRVSNDAPTTDSQDLNRRAERTRMKRPVWESREAMFEAYRTRAAFKDWADEPFQEFITGGTNMLPDGRAELKCHPETEATFYGMRDDLPVENYLRGLTGQWLLLLADYPGCQRPDDAGVRQFQELVAGSRVKAMGKGSHFLPMEYPEAVLEAALSWFDAGGAET